MSGINIITDKVKKYATYQQLVDFLSYLIFSCTIVLISVTIALFLFKSPIYGFIGIVPFLFYRPTRLLERARELEKKIGLKGEIVNSIQLAQIPYDNKEKYSKELINAYIDESAQKIEGIDCQKFVDYKKLNKVLQIFMVSVAIALIHPAAFPERFWYSIYHRIDYKIAPGNVEYPKGTNTNLVLQMWGVYIPKSVTLVTSDENRITKEKIEVEDGIAERGLEISEPLTYHFELIGQKTRRFNISTIEPLYIENLSFYLKYPKYTKLGEELKTGRQLVAPAKTTVRIEGRASEALKSAQLEFIDTLGLQCVDKDFRGEFMIETSGIATLYLQSRSEQREPIRIYAIPNLTPLVDIFYPGFDINMPFDMNLDIGIRCSDDYGLEAATFYYNFEKEMVMPLNLRKGALEDTVYFNWDLSNLGMLPGDEVSYYVVVKDNSGNTTRSKIFHVYFPTMEQMYDEISEKEGRVYDEFQDLQEMHSDEINEIKRITEKIMREREFSWADQEKLRAVMAKEGRILEQIEEWQQELEKTIEQLKEGIILDQKSIERLNEIAKILQEIAPEELRNALENLQMAMEKKPADVQKALEQLKNKQEELAQTLERTLELLKRFQQEEKLRELAKMAMELALEQEEIENLAQIDEAQALEKQGELDAEIEALAEELAKIGQAENLEDEIKDALKELAKQLKDLAQETRLKKSKTLKNVALNLERLYEQLTKSRSANLRRNLLKSLEQIIETSKTQEQLLDKEPELQSILQEDLIQATKTIADSLYGQQIKSLHVTPRMGKGLARAMLSMKEAQKLFGKGGRQGVQKARQAMMELNLVAFEIIQALKKASEGGSSTGMDAFLQGLSEITQGQMSLNQSLSGLFPIPTTGLTPMQRAQLQRLAGRQRALREALESLRGQAGVGEHQELLDNIINEMREMENDLHQYKLNRELIERQKKVISRLLDSQRSIRKEDYTEKRKSKVGQDFPDRVVLEPSPKDLGRDQLREMLQQELRGSYPKDYEPYIREYFKKLLEEQ